MNYPFIATSKFISVTIDNKPHTVPSTHMNFLRLEAALKDENWELVKKVVNLSGAIQEFCGGSILIKEGVLFYHGQQVDTSITRRIMDMMKEGFNIEPLVNFLDNLMDNPSYRATQELYGFLEYGKLPITDDGYFLAYKKVSDNFMDIHSGTFDNSVGSVCEMERNQVDEDKNRTCSAGLHFCSYEYLSSFGTSSSNNVVVLKINPADVVAIPSDYNNTKGRCCKYEVIDEVEGWEDENTLAKTSVYVGNEDTPDEPHRFCDCCDCILTAYEEDTCDSCLEGNDDDIPEYCEVCGTVEVTNEGDSCLACTMDEEDEGPLCVQCEAELVSTEGDRCESCQNDNSYDIACAMSSTKDTPETLFPTSPRTTITVIVEDDEDEDIGPAEHPNQAQLDFDPVRNMKCPKCGGLMAATATECTYCDCTDLVEVI